MNKTKLNIGIVNAAGIRVNPNLIVGDTGSYSSGDILDANAVEAVIKEQIDDVVDGAVEALDTLKELGNAIPTNVSQLNNDAGYITQSNGQLLINQLNITVISNQPFPSSWPTSNQYTLQDLVDAIDADQDAIQGKVYMATVHYSDLSDAVGLVDGELKVEIMQSGDSHKIARFTITSANASPYYWLNTMWNGQLHNISNVTGKKWVSFVPSTDIKAVATSGDYNDLTNKPTIPIGTITSVKMNGTTISSSGEADLGTVITEHQSLANYVTKTEFNNAISDSADDWYGIEWTSENATPHRIGNMNMHRNLPIQSGMKRCMVQDNGTIYGYISSSDPIKYDDGRTADYTGTHGQVMVEIPEYHYDALSYVENNVTYNVLKLYPYSNKGKLSKKIYVGAMEGITDDANSNATTKKLYSICLANVTVTNGEVNASEVTYEIGASNYRGGSTSTSSTNDDNVKSLLGKPKTNLTRANFRTRAAARGTGWSQQYWNAYMSVVRLYVVEFSNFNSQDTYYSTEDSNGYKRGGLGAGVSTADSTTWNIFNAYNPFIPCGVTKSLGNNTGVITYKFAASEFASSATSFTVPSYRGIENPFGHIWKWTDGININTTSRNTTVYTCENITNFADDTSTNYLTRVTFAKPSNGYIKTWNWDNNGDFIPTGTSGSDSSYLCDYSNWAAGWKVLSSSGSANVGAGCGWFCFNANSASAYATALFGGRLYFTPQN